MVTYVWLGESEGKPVLRAQRFGPDGIVAGGWGDDLDWNALMDGALAVMRHIDGEVVFSDTFPGAHQVVNCLEVYVADAGVRA